MGERSAAYTIAGVGKNPIYDGVSPKIGGRGKKWRGVTEGKKKVSTTKNPRKGKAIFSPNLTKEKGKEDKKKRRFSGP